MDTREMIVRCQAKVEQLRQEGWTQKDFANALTRMLYEEIEKEARQREEE